LPVRDVERGGLSPSQRLSTPPSMPYHARRTPAGRPPSRFLLLSFVTSWGSDVPGGANHGVLRTGAMWRCPGPMRDTSAWVQLFWSECLDRGAGGAGGAPGPCSGAGGGGGNHGDAPSWWSWPRRCSIVVVAPGPVPGLPGARGAGASAGTRSPGRPPLGPVPAARLRRKEPHRLLDPSQTDVAVAAAMSDFSVLSFNYFETA
jgi:hypothetical protein